jgi:uncharacterized membrane protein YidH (DUF202 family)
VTAFDPDSRDPGLAAERTDLAWNRSGLALLACGAAIMRGLADTPLTHGNLAVGGCILTLGILTWALGTWHAYRRRARGAGQTTTSDLLPITIGVAAVGVAAFVLAAAGPS